MLTKDVPLRKACVTLCYATLTRQIKVGEESAIIGVGGDGIDEEDGGIARAVAMLLLGLTVRDVFWLSFIPGLIALVIFLFLV